MLVGGLPSLVSCAAKNIEKQPACAAPISSSGFVPFSLLPSKREAKVNGASKPVPLTLPLPSLRVPFQVADAFETAMVSPFRDGASPNSLVSRDGQPQPR